jgi:hypothetical protein
MEGQVKKVIVRSRPTGLQHLVESLIIKSEYLFVFRAGRIHH